MGVVLAHALLAGVAREAGGSTLVARILGPERRGIDAALLASIARDLSTGLARVMSIVTALAVGAALVGWLFPHVSAAKEAAPAPTATR
jgi:hypothetical protein